MDLEADHWRHLRRCHCPKKLKAGEAPKNPLETQKIGPCNGRAVPKQANIPPQYTAADPTKNTDRTKESRTESEKNEADLRAPTYIVTKTLSVIHKSTERDLEVQPDKVALFSNPKFRVQITVESSKLVMHLATCLKDTWRERIMLEYNFFPLEWRRRIQQLPTKKLLTVTKPAIYMAGVNHRSSKLQSDELVLALA